MGRYPKKRGNGWTKRKCGSSNGSNINRKRSIERKKEYKNKHKIKSKIINKLNIKNIQNMQQQNDDLSKENKRLLNKIDKLGDAVYDLQQQINDRKNNDNHCDSYKYINQDIKNEKKFDILHLLSSISPNQLKDILLMINKNISSEILSISTLKIWGKMYCQIFSHLQISNELKEGKLGTNDNLILGSDGSSTRRFNFEVYNVVDGCVPNTNANYSKRMIAQRQTADKSAQSIANG